MKVKIISHPKQTLEVNNVYFSSDLHLNHKAIIDFGRKFNNVEEMNNTIYANINNKVGKDDLLVLLGDTLMVDKDYNKFLSLINCENIIMLYGNHCNVRRFEEVNGYPANKLLYHGYYLELSIDKQIICCSHYPMFHWNFQSDDSFELHGHCHGDEPSEILKEIHKYKCMDVGIDNYYNIFGTYDVFSFQDIENLLHNKLIAHRH
jgi:calcineurin-like phosphoesterase family protein